MTENNIMQFESVLPADFDGTFRFTNWTNEEFVGKWGGKEYRFAAGTTSPMVILDQTPLEIQQIRKKFARDLAEREFYRSQSYNTLLSQQLNRDNSPRLNSIHQAGTYSLETLTPFIQRCLEPLPVAKAEVRKAPQDPLEDKLSRNEKGELNSEVIDKKISLRKKALEA